MRKCSSSSKSKSKQQLITQYVKRENVATREHAESLQRCTSGIIVSFNTKTLSRMLNVARWIHLQYNALERIEQAATFRKSACAYYCEFWSAECGRLLQFAIITIDEQGCYDEKLCDVRDGFASLLNWLPSNASTTLNFSTVDDGLLGLQFVDVRNVLETTAEAELRKINDAKKHQQLEIFQHAYPDQEEDFYMQHFKYVAVGVRLEYYKGRIIFF